MLEESPPFAHNPIIYIIGRTILTLKVKNPLETARLLENKELVLANHVYIELYVGWLKIFLSSFVSIRLPPPILALN